jgi:ubiquinol oxidase
MKAGIEGGGMNGIPPDGHGEMSRVGGPVDTDLKREQQASLARPRLKYSLAARFFFLSMDLFAGKRTTLAKAKLLETLASVPYRAWETRQYQRLTRGYRDAGLVGEAREIIDWSRTAQDNEYWHLLVIDEKMKEDGAGDAWYLFPPLAFIMVGVYALFSRVLARFSMRRALRFNAEFEDHAEHAYAHFVEEHPEWESQPAAGPQAKAYAGLPTWADVFRRIGLDERGHKDRSLALCVPARLGGE